MFFGNNKLNSSVFLDLARKYEVNFNSNFIKLCSSIAVWCETLAYNFNVSNSTVELLFSYKNGTTVLYFKIQAYL